MFEDHRLGWLLIGAEDPAVVGGVGRAAEAGALGFPSRLLEYIKLRRVHSKFRLEVSTPPARSDNFAFEAKSDVSSWRLGGTKLLLLAVLSRHFSFQVGGGLKFWVTYP